MAKERPKDQVFPSAPSKSIMFDPGPEFYSPARRERRQKLLKLAEASFPDGVPSPYAVLPLCSREKLPFVCATISVTNDYDRSQQFQDVWCLWDTGATISHILTGILNEEIRGSSTEGYVSGEIMYAFQRLECTLVCSQHSCQLCWCFQHLCNILRLQGTSAK